MTDPLTTGSIALGTAQLGMPYGVRAAADTLTESAAFAVLDAAWAHGIRRFDTAVAYGCAAPRVARWLKLRGRAADATVTTKLHPAMQRADLQDALSATLEQFAAVGHLNLLTHGFARPGQQAEWLEAVRSGVAGRQVGLGMSVYTLEEAVQAGEWLEADVIQLPVHVLDFPTLKGVTGLSHREVQARSIFLQGLLLQHPVDADARVPGSGTYVRAVHQVAETTPMDLSAFLLRAVSDALPSGRVLVLGAEHPRQIEEWAVAVEAAASAGPVLLDELEAQLGWVPAAIRDPRLWKSPQSSAAPGQTNQC